jgi:hypothetical protein
MKLHLRPIIALALTLSCGLAAAAAVVVQAGDRPANAADSLPASRLPAPSDAANGVSALQRAAPVSVSPSTQALLVSMTDFSAVQSPTIRAGAPGAPLLAQAHRLLDAVGTQRWSLDAVPTDRGAVCFVLGDFEGGCVNSFSAMPLNENASDHGGRWHVWGLVDDSVQSVAVTVAGVRLPLPIVNNAYFYEVPADVDPRAVTDITASTRAGQGVSVALSRQAR